MTKTKDILTKGKKLFLQTIDENFTGEKANEAKWRADKMAEMFQLKMSHYKNIEIKPLRQ